MIKTKYIKENDTYAIAPWYLSFFVRVENDNCMIASDFKEALYTNKKLKLKFFTKCKYVTNSTFWYFTDQEDIKEYIINLKTNLVSVKLKSTLEINYLIQDIVKNGNPEILLIIEEDSTNRLNPYFYENTTLTDFEFVLNDDESLTLNFIHNF